MATIPSLGAFKFSNINPNAPVTAKGDMPSQILVRTYQQMLDQLTAQVNSQNAVINQLTALTAAQQQQLNQIDALNTATMTNAVNIIATTASLSNTNTQLNTVAVTANAAYSGGSTPNQSQGAVANSSTNGTTWVTVATCSFPAAVACTHNNITASGVTAPGALYTLAGAARTAGTFTGNVRVMEVIGGTPTVLQTESFSVVFTAGDPGAISGGTFTYNAADTNTGAISYQIQVQSTSSFNLQNFQATIAVTRTP